MTQKCHLLTGGHLEVAVERRKLAYTPLFTSYKLVAPVGGNHVIGNDVTCPKVTGGDPEVTSFDLK